MKRCRSESVAVTVENKQEQKKTRVLLRTVIVDGEYLELFYRNDGSIRETMRQKLLRWKHNMQPLLVTDREKRVLVPEDINWGKMKRSIPREPKPRTQQSMEHIAFHGKDYFTLISLAERWQVPHNEVIRRALRLLGLFIEGKELRIEPTPERYSPRPLDFEALREGEVRWKRRASSQR